MMIGSSKVARAFDGPYVHAILLFIFAALFRFFHLDKMGFWIDEVATVQHVSMSLKHPYINTLYFSNPPLFHLLVKPFYLIFGRDDYWLRFPCALIGSVTVPVVYAVLRKLLSVRAGWTGALILAVSPFHIWYSQEFRMYTLVALESTLLLFLWAKARESDSTKTWLCYAFVVVLSLYTHYWFLFFISAQYLWIMIEYAAGKKISDRNILILLFAPLLFVPWIPAMIRQIYEDKYTFIPPVRVSDIGRAFQIMAYGIAYPFGVWQVSEPSNAMKVVVYYIPMSLPVLGVCWPGVQRKRFVEFYLVGILIPLMFVFTASILYMPLFVPRYNMMLLPAFLFCISRISESPHRLFRSLMTLVAVLWLVVAGYALNTYYFNMDKAVGKQIWTYVNKEPGFLLCTQYLDILDSYSVNYYGGMDLLKIWWSQRVPSASELSKASYDLVIPVPRNKSYVLENLPSGWQIKSRKLIANIDVVRLSKIRGAKQS